ncbi:MAG: hypothetical protein M1825_005528 [Sarcosagium campestre]|nr:MAG: hypothetical protein M1825_005528 [Sarcosagium campestre]
MASEISVLEGEVKEYKLQLETVQSGLQADSENAELQNLKIELEEVIALTESAIAELKPTSAQPQTSSERATSPNVKEKWSRDNHPAFKAGYRKPAAPQSPVDDPTSSSVFAVNDSVMARWTSGDNSFYPARITSITGSSSAPVYIVTFKSYATTETLSSKDIKPMSSDSKKRKAEFALGPSPSAVAASSNIISADADIDTALANKARTEPSKVSDGPPRPAKVPRKVKANKELEQSKSKWQDFSSKGKIGKGGRKDSMFRTPDGVHGRVGFTGSGQTMRKDPARSRHIYQHGAEEEPT